jgi:diguanylate cyclase (GGDEF)-like protein
MSDKTLPKPRRILVIDDNDAIHRDFRKTLSTGQRLSGGLATAKAALFDDVDPNPPTASDSGVFELVTALQGEDGFHQAESARKQGSPFNVAFVDMRMPPGWDGLQTIQHLWEVDPDLEVVICTAYSDYSLEEISEKLGVSDKLLILKKPFDPIEVSQLAATLSEKWKLKQNAHLKLEALEEMVEQRTVDLAHAALHDKLTGMPNREFLRRQMDKAIERRRTDPNFNFALLFLDFDRFKIVNDSLGHEAGDQLLIAISQRLSQTTGAENSKSGRPIAARLGGDEFVVLFEQMKDNADAIHLAERLLKSLSEPYDIAGHHITSTASIGITTASLGYTSAGDMLRDADTAMYRAKAAGRGHFVVFDKAMHDEMMIRLEMENQLRDAASQGQLRLYFQPVISLTGGDVHNVESLIRWQHPSRGLIVPADFIPCSEETGLIIPMGEWILTEACRQLRAWQQIGPRQAQLSMSVNFSIKQLMLPDIAQRVKKIITAADCETSSIILDVSESAVMRHIEDVIPVLSELRDLGVQLHLDDFGIGYSSLSSLHRLPITGLKIDRGFTQHITQRRDYAAIVESIVTLARNLDLTLIAEGINDKDQAVMLQAMGCQAAQGFLFSPPMDARKTEEFLRTPQNYSRLNAA